ncbi:hypothetical protein P7H12_00080 [Paenibacillus larvae]|nr:hypothetical protein [Paenibacillus larvae]MDT2262370.1 hypothetical protein [Paenibacillus larvae]
MTRSIIGCLKSQISSTATRTRRWQHQPAHEEDDDGQPIFRAGRDKIFEVDKDETFTPEYITWDGRSWPHLKSLKRQADFLLTTAELPPVALAGALGTSMAVRGSWSSFG